MNKSITNILVLAGIVITAVAGYFLFTQDSTMFLSTGSSDQQLEQLLQSSQLFVERSRTLSQITMDTTLFDDPVFTSLKSFSPPPGEFGVGRNNPFTPVRNTAPTQ